MANPTWFDPTDYNLPSTYVLPSSWVLGDPATAAHQLDASQQKMMAARIKKQASEIVESKLSLTIPTTFEKEVKHDKGMRRKRHDFRRRFHEIEQWVDTLNNANYLYYRLMQEAIYGAVDGVDVINGDWWAPDGRTASVPTEHADLNVGRVHVREYEDELVSMVAGSLADRMYREAALIRPLNTEQKRKLGVIRRRANEIVADLPDHPLDVENPALWGDAAELSSLSLESRIDSTAEFSELLNEDFSDNPSQTRFTVTVPNGHDELRLKAAVKDSASTFSIRIRDRVGTVTERRQNSSYIIKTGDNRRIEVIVQSELRLLEASRRYAIYLNHPAI